MKNKISVIIPCYNSEKTIEKCVLSIEEQTYNNFEIIIINDGSIDNTYNICQNLSNKYDNIILINQENSGHSFARNKGIDSSNGEFVFFIDSDDYLDKKVFEVLINNFEENCLCGVMHKNIIGEKSFIKEYKTMYDKDSFIKAFCDNELGGYCWGYLFEKNKLSDLRFDTQLMMLEDAVFVFNYLKKVSKIKYINNLNDMFYNYYINPDSITNKISIDRIENNIKNIDVAISSIKSIIDNENDILNIKECKLITYELNKLNTMKDIKILKNDIDVNNIFNKLTYKDIYIKLFLFKCLVPLWLLLKTKRLYKLLKKGARK